MNTYNDYFIEGDFDNTIENNIIENWTNFPVYDSITVAPIFGPIPVYSSITQAPISYR